MENALQMMTVSELFMRIFELLCMFMHNFYTFWNKDKDLHCKYKIKGNVEYKYENNLEVLTEYVFEPMYFILANSVSLITAR